jgi:hypothetical protein
MGLTMTSLHLVELARQGDPEAIASLMNLTLQPKGITAETRLDDRCLSVFLTSPQALNKETLVNFVRRGLVNLGTTVIQQVKIYGCKPGQETPTWKDAFRMGLEAPDLTSDANPGFPNLYIPKPEPAYVAASGTSLASESVAVLPALPDNRDLPAQPTAQPLPPIQPVRTATQRRRAPRRQTRLKLLVAAVMAFLVGGTIVMLSNARNASNPVGTPETPANAAQKEAKDYLVKLIKAQQEHHKTKNQLSLKQEDLERMAQVGFLSSSSYNYSFKAASPEMTIFGATPTQDGLKSYTAAVVVAKTPEGTTGTLATICETTNFSKSFLEAPQFPSNQPQCPNGTARIY